MPSLLARTARHSFLAASLLLLAACGGGDSGEDVAAADPPPVAPGPPPAQPAPPTAEPSPPPTEPNPPAPEMVLADTHTALVAGTINSRPGWPAWVAPAGRAPVNGVGCLVNEDYHIHTLVSIYKDGVRQGLPENIGRSGCAY